MSPLAGSSQSSCCAPSSARQDSCAGQPGRAGGARFQAAAPAARDDSSSVARASQRAGSACSPDAASVTGTASIQRVMGSRKTPSVPVRKIAHSSQPQLRPHQVCSQDMLCRKPGFTSFPANGPGNGGGASAHSVPRSVSITLRGSP